MIRHFAIAASAFAFVPLAFALSTSGDSGSATPATPGLVQLPAGQRGAPAPTPSATPGSTSPSTAPATTTRAATPTPALTPLAPLDLSGMALWRWSARWHASEWDNGNSHIPWRYNRVTKQTNGDVNFRLDSTGAPQLQAVDGTTGQSRGLWEVEATIPQLREGMVVAPLWLYNSSNKDEIDFEFVGRRGLDLSIHAYPGGVHQQNTVRLFADTDLSGRRMRFGIQLDEAAGTATMLIDGAPVHTWTRASLGWFPTQPVKPFMEVWAAKPTLTWLTQWTGVWTNLPSGDHRTMTIHGYGFTPAS